VKEIVSGDFRKAHQLGADLSSGVLANIDQEADVSIVSAFPLSMRSQVMKPLCTATMVTKGDRDAGCKCAGRNSRDLLETLDIAYQMAKAIPKSWRRTIYATISS
jgi:hypothetical protein